MKTRNIIGAAAALALAVTASPASAVDLHGYLRSGIGGNSMGTAQTCYGISPIGHKFRLGNECETYAELEFDQVVYKDASGVIFKYTGMLAYKTTQSQDWEGLAPSVSQDGTTKNISVNGNDAIALRQNWIGATLPQYGNVTFWAGKRYYMRNDIHITDWFYWDVSGPGAGVENIDVGVGKLHLALFESKSSDKNGGPDFGYTSGPMWRPDVRVTNIQANQNGSIEVGVDLFMKSTPKGQGSNAQQISPWFTIQHIQTDFFGGLNKLAFQYASGTAAPMSAYPAGGNDSKSSQWRIVEMMVLNPSPQWSGMLTASYSDKTRMYGDADKTNHWNNSTQWEFGVRPEYHVNDFVKVAAELGYQASTAKADPGPGNPSKTISMFKATLAPTITLPAGPGGAFFTRPDLRVFVTYASFDKKNPAWVYNDGILNSNVGTTLTEGNGLTFGAQLEAWF